MKNLTVSLATAKRLKEAGWGKETEFWWSHDWEQSNEEASPQYALIRNKDFGFGYFDRVDSFPAPTLQEILEELPCEFEFNYEPEKTMSVKWYILKVSKGYCVVIYDCDTGDSLEDLLHVPENLESSVEMAGLLWLRLKQQQLI